MSNDIWMIMFYSPECGHCKKMRPIWEIVSTAMRNTTRVGVLDVTDEDNKGLAAKFKVRKVPTIKIFGFSKKNPKKRTRPFDYTGERTTVDIITWLKKYNVNRMVHDRSIQILVYKEVK